MFKVFQELKVLCSCDIYYFVCQLDPFNKRTGLEASV